MPSHHVPLPVGERPPLAQALIRARRRAMLSQRDLAARAGVDLKVVARAEAGGRIPRVSSLRKLVAALPESREALLDAMDGAL